MNINSCRIHVIFVPDHMTDIQHVLDIETKDTKVMIGGNVPNVMYRILVVQDPTIRRMDFVPHHVSKNLYHKDR